MKASLLALALLGTPAPGEILTPATGGRLTDYTNWFSPFAVASDATYTGVPYPRTNIPDTNAIDNVNRDWSGWAANWTPGLYGPIVFGSYGHPDFVEIVFLGETAAWWNDWGYTLNGVDHLFVDGIQSSGPAPNVQFGDYALLHLEGGDTLDFFVTGSGIRQVDGAITIGPEGGRYHVFGHSLDVPAPFSHQSYFGMLRPLTSVRGPEFLGAEDGSIPFTVMAFEDQSVGGDGDYNDLVFAFRYWQDIPCCGGVPEMATHGPAAGALLLGLIAWRLVRGKRSHAANRPATT